MLSENMFLSVNAGCLVFLLIFLLSFTLSLIPLALALTVMLANIYHILRAIFAPSLQQSRLLKSEGKGDLHRFEQRVREGSDHSMRRAETRRNDEYCWGKAQIRQSQRIQELRKVPLIEEYKVELSRRDTVSYRDEGSSAKKVRTFFQKPATQLDERLNAKIVEAVQGEGTLENKNSTQIGKRINSCLKILLEFLNSKMERDVEAIIQDFEAASRFLSRCFSVTLTLKHPTDQAISPMQLLELVRILQRKQMIPSRFTPTLSIVQILHQLSQVRQKIARLPSFSQGAAVLRMLLSIKHLKKEFPNETITFADYSKQQAKEGDVRVIRLQDNGKFYCNSQPQIKSEGVEVVLLVLLIKIIKKYIGSSHLARTLYAQLDAKYSFQ